jgi:protoporphyrinogen oxidase
MSGRIVVLGAGMTGLAAARASGGMAYEAEAAPGGICSSYHLAPGEPSRRGGHDRAPAYRFEIGGGHWIFGGDPATLALIESLAPARRYTRRSSVYFPDEKLFVPYPLQNHLRYLGSEVATRALAEMRAGGAGAVTMREWLVQSFGATLAERFFEPFHALYTGGLHARIAPQDGYKSPVNLDAAARGAVADAPPAGYNVTFLYPGDGLDALAARLLGTARVVYGRRAVSIDTTRREVVFADGSSAGYDHLISTLPLNRALELAGLDAGAPDPHTSVLVLNVGAIRGGRCPQDHWVYVPRSRAGFHRVGFYSNVDPAFLPAAPRSAEPRVSVYVERAYAGGTRPDARQVAAYAADAVRELQDWGFIGEVEVLDPTWIDVAYTWAWPGSRWRETALRELEERGVRQVGRYARWTFQGIADSIRDGLAEGRAVAELASR